MREREFAGFAEAFKRAMRCGDLLEGSLSSPSGIIISVVLVIEAGDCFDQACLAFNRFNQSQPMLFNSGVVQADDRYRAYHQGGGSHNQEELVEWLALHHL